MTPQALLRRPWLGFVVPLSAVQQPYSAVETWQHVALHFPSVKTSLRAQKEPPVVTKCVCNFERPIACGAIDGPGPLGAVTRP